MTLCKSILLLYLNFFVGPTLSAATFAYSYDPLNRITNAAYSNGSQESYSYDPVGNRVQRITGIFDTVPPSVPTGLAVSTNAYNQIVLSWNIAQDSGTGVAGYYIYLNGVLYTNTEVSIVPLTALAPNMAYCITVAAYDYRSEEHTSE